MNDPRIAALEARMLAAEARLAAIEGRAPTSASGGSEAGGGVASDEDLDGPHGNPKVKKDPPRWRGQGFAGLCMSACTPEYLDVLAAFLDWRADREAEQSDKAKYARFSRLDAARARGWAKRIRARTDDDEIPF